MSRIVSSAPRPVALGLLLACTLAAGAGEPSSQADWPQFRGPRRDNLSPDKGLLTSWPKGGPQLVWKGTGVGVGFSTVSVAGDKVFTMGDEAGACRVFALSRATGKKLWSARVGRTGGNYSGPRCTPTVDGDRVYAIGQFGDLVCLDAATGKERWRKSFTADFRGRSGNWNFTESPLVDGDWLVCTPGGQDATMVALDKRTGDEVWRCPARTAAGYASVVISNAGNVKQYVNLTAGGTIGVRAKDGKLLWEYRKLGGNVANIPTPIPVGDQVFTCAGYGKGGALLTLSASGDKVTTKEVYYNDELRNKHGGATIVGDLVFADTDDRGQPYCADWHTGEVKWKRPRGKDSRGSGSAAITYADGHLYVRYNNGWVALVPATAGGYVEKGSFKIPNSDTNSWPHPVVIGGRLYLREKDTVWCYDVKGK
jgi:outer membrane protein assembly factor BamB